MAEENSMSVDLYDDMLTASVEKRERKHASLEKEVEFLRKENEMLNGMSTKLNTEAETIIKNMSSLLQTAKLEISRKNEEIKELKAEVNRLKKRSYIEAKRNQERPSVDIRDIRSFNDRLQSRRIRRSRSSERSHRSRDTKSKSSERLLASPEQLNSPLTTITNKDKRDETDNKRGERKRRLDVDECNTNINKKARLSISGYKKETQSDTKNDPGSHRNIPKYTRSDRDLHLHHHRDKSRTAKCADDIKNKYRHKNISGNRCKIRTKLDITPKKRDRGQHKNHKEIPRPSFTDLNAGACDEESSSVNHRDLERKDEEDRKNRKELLISTMSKVFQYGMIAEQRYHDEYDFRRHQHRKKHQRQRRNRHKLNDSSGPEPTNQTKVPTENNVTSVNEQGTAVKETNIETGNVLDNQTPTDSAHVDLYKGVSSEPPRGDLSKKQNLSDEHTDEVNDHGLDIKEQEPNKLIKLPNEDEPDTEKVERSYRDDNEKVAFHIGDYCGPVDLAADLEISNITTLSEQEDNDDNNDAHDEDDDDLYGDVFNEKHGEENPKVDAAQDESLFDIANDIEPDTKLLPEDKSEIPLNNTPEEQNKPVQLSNMEESKCESDNIGIVSDSKDSKNSLSSFMNKWMTRCKVPVTESSTNTASTAEQKQVNDKIKSVADIDETIIKDGTEKAPVEEEVDKKQVDKFPSFLDKILNDCAAGLRMVREHEQANDQQNIDPSRMTNTLNMEPSSLNNPNQDNLATKINPQSEKAVQKTKRPKLDFNNLPPELVTLVKSVASIPPKARLKALKSLPPDLQAFMEAFEASQGRESPLMHMEDQLQPDHLENTQHRPNNDQNKTQFNVEPSNKPDHRLSPQIFQTTPNMNFPPPAFNPNMVNPIGSGLCRPVPVQANLAAVLQHMLLQAEAQNQASIPSRAPAFPNKSIGHNHHTRGSLVKRSKTQKDPRLNKQSDPARVFKTDTLNKISSNKSSDPPPRQKIPFKKLRETPILIPYIRIDSTTKITDPREKPSPNDPRLNDPNVISHKLKITNGDPRLTSNTPQTLKHRLARSKSLGDESKHEVDEDNHRPVADLVVVNWNTKQGDPVVQKRTFQASKTGMQNPKADQTKDISSAQLFNVAKMLEKPKPLGGLESVTTKLGGFTIPKKKSSKSESEESFIDKYTLPLKPQLKKSRESLEKIPGIKIKNKTQVKKNVSSTENNDANLESKVMTFLSTERNKTEKAKQKPTNSVSSDPQRVKKTEDSSKHKKSTIISPSDHIVQADIKNVKASTPILSSVNFKNTSKDDVEKRGKNPNVSISKTSEKIFDESVKHVKQDEVKSNPPISIDDANENKEPISGEFKSNAGRAEEAMNSSVAKEVMNSTVIEHTFGETLIPCGGANSKTPVLKVKSEFCDDNDNTMDLALRVEKLDELYGSTTNTPLKNPNFDTTASSLNDDLCQSNDSHTLFIDENASDPAIFDPSENRRGSLTFSSPLKRITPLKTPTKFNVSYSDTKSDTEPNIVKMDLFRKSDVAEVKTSENRITSDGDAKILDSITKTSEEKLCAQSKDQQDVGKDTAASFESEKKSLKKDTKYGSSKKDKVGSKSVKSDGHQKSKKSDKNSKSKLKKEKELKSSHSLTVVDENPQDKTNETRSCGNNENSCAHQKDKKVKEKEVQLKVREKNIKDVKISDEKHASSVKKDTKDKDEKLKQAVTMKTKKRKHSETHDHTKAKSQKL